MTEVTAATAFYDAEEYHQDYYRKNPLRYKFYRYRCGRDKRLETPHSSDQRAGTLNVYKQLLPCGDDETMTARAGGGVNARRARS